MSNIARVEFVDNNLRGRNFGWVKRAKILTSAGVYKLPSIREVNFGNKITLKLKLG